MKFEITADGTLGAKQASMDLINAGITFTHEQRGPFCHVLTVTTDKGDVIERLRNRFSVQRIDAPSPMPGHCGLGGRRR
jgi:hypothetical protein